MTTPIPYNADVERHEPDEDEHIQRCIDSLRRTNAKTFDVHRHGYRATHAKSHGILRGELSVADGLPVELAQGLFSSASTFLIIAHIAT